MPTKYAKRYKTTLSQDEDAIAGMMYGAKARPELHKDLSIQGLITANCGDRGAAGWRRFAKEIYQSIVSL